jgi:adenine-specific DNA-methyltransferase
MKTLTAKDSETKSSDIVAANIEQLNTLFHDAFTEGKLDFEVLKQLLGGAVDEREEKYGLNWHGKRRARQLALTPSTGTLRPCPEDSVDWDTTCNLMIEGDNLEVLKLLQKSYAGKVKLIYIDPPYNTGKDFVYPDNFQDNIKNYLQLTGQADGNGNKICSNTEVSGRFHTDWLNMMYPRLKLARNLLREDGAILCSIDDRELINLRAVFDELFGNENFLGQLVWHSKKGGGGDVKTIVAEHEYIVAYSKMNPESSVGKQSVEAQPLNLTDERGPYRKGRELNKWGAGSARADRRTMFFPIPGPNGEDVYPIRNDGSEGRWRLGKPAMFQIVRDGNALFEKRENGSYIVFEKIRSADPRQKSYRTLLTDVGTAADGTAILKELFDGKSPFDFPKPVRLLSKLIDLAGVDEEDIVLDFFAGSGTTAHAVMAKNTEVGGSRRFILVQLPEPLDPANKDQKGAADYCDKLGKPRNIAELTKERLRRAGRKIKDENATIEGDRGFRVFKLASSNIRAWEPDRENLAQTLEASVEHLKTDRTEADVLYELLLKLGLDLIVPIEEKTLADKTVHSVGAGTLLVCLAEKIAREDVEQLALGIVDWYKTLAPASESTVVFRDSAFADDVAKTNLAAILQQHGLSNVRSL